MGKSTISMAIFNSYVANYQRVFRESLFLDDLFGNGGKTSDGAIASVHGRMSHGHGRMLL